MKTCFNKTEVFFSTRNGGGYTTFSNGRSCSTRFQNIKKRSNDGINQDEFEIEYDPGLMKKVTSYPFKFQKN